ncbi:MAG TPA: SsrA-binding protein SmpB [Candidatus Saccharimonadales bacterium]|jgi:SsrA-binding protein|nr:SsrA-binding protein SmpB [Candidatus Saccharimonadales bacterium]
MAKKKPSSKVISNRRARFDYRLSEPLTVGIVLNGAETKAIRNGHAQLTGAYVNILNNELWLINATITGSNAAPILEEDKTRSRKLLASRKEIDNLSQAKKTGSTIVPLEILAAAKYIKLRIAYGVGNKNYDKREIIKKRDEQRKIQNYVRNKK